MTDAMLIRVGAIHASELRALDLREHAAKARFLPPPELSTAEIDDELALIPRERWFDEMASAAFRIEGDVSGEALVDFGAGRIAIATNGNAVWGDYRAPEPVAYASPPADATEAEARAAAGEYAVIDAIRDAIRAFATDPDWSR